MASAYTEVARLGIGKDRVAHIGKWAADNSYTTGGYALTAATLGFSDVAANLLVCPFPSKGYVAEYDGANAKLLLYRQTAATSALVEVANAVDVSAITAMIVLTFGRLEV